MGTTLRKKTHSKLARLAVPSYDSHLILGYLRGPEDPNSGICLDRVNLLGQLLRCVPGHGHPDEENFLGSRAEVGVPMYGPPDLGFPTAGVGVSLPAPGAGGSEDGRQLPPL